MCTHRFQGDFTEAIRSSHAAWTATLNSKAKQGVGKAMEILKHIG
jgi:hypothetical protein